MKARELGIEIGFGTPGPLNAITDVAGVKVGHTTIIEGDGPLIVGKGPIRTGAAARIAQFLPWPPDRLGHGRTGRVSTESQGDLRFGDELLPLRRLN